MEPAKHVLSDRGVDLYTADWRALAEVARAAGGVDALIVDAPYSDRTHQGHNGVTEAVNKRPVASVGCDRRGLHYAAWGPAEVREFVSTWAPLVRGWMVSLTDDVLFPVWRAAMEETGRLAFQDVPCCIVGMTVRLTGDGPSSWAIHAAVARPRSKAWATWGTLPGCYHGPSQASTHGAIGGKPEWLVRALLRDYTRPGDLVADPCCGFATLGTSAIQEGRRALLGDVDAGHLGIASKRILAAPGYQGRLALDVESKPMTPTGFDFG